MYKFLPILLFAYGLCLDNSTENNETVPNVLPNDDLLIFEHIILDDWIEDSLDYLNYVFELYESENKKMIQKIVHEKLSIVINPNNIRIDFQFIESVEKLFKSQWKKDDYKKKPEEIINDINIWINREEFIDENVFGEFDYNKQTIITRILPFFDFNTALRYKTQFKKYQLLHNDLAIDKVYAKFMQENQFINDQEELFEVDGYLLYHGAGIFNISIDQQIKPQPIDMIKDIMINLYPHLQHCDDCISFESVDIDSIKRVNEKVKSTTSLNRDDIYDDSWAVIIGIDKYKYSKQLNYAVKDAEAVKEMLISKFDFPEDNIKYLVNEEATLSGIKLALDDISTSADENDRILIFYSGHGETIQGIDGTEKGYIIPYEGKQKKAYATGLAMDEILTISMLSKSKHMLFLMDACYSGLMTQQFKGLAKPTEEGYLTKVANESARQIITAGGRDEQVIERDEWQHSAFTKNLIEGLDTWEADYNDDGCITADELSSYLREHVTEDSDFQQTPQDGRFRNSGGGEFVFFGEGNKSSNQDGSPSTINNISISKIIESTHMQHDFISYNLSIVHVYKSFLSNEELMRYSCMDAGWTHYSNDKMGFRIAYNYCLDKNSNSSFINPRDVQLRTNGITMEFNYRVHRGTKFTLSPSNRLPEQYGEYKFLYFSLGFTLAKANYYSITSDFLRKGIGIIPEFGFGISLLGSRSPLFMLKLGYPFFNMLDENNSKVLNGIIMNLEFGIDLITW